MKSSNALLTADQGDLFFTKMYDTSNWTMTTTGTTQPEYHKENMVAIIVKQHSKGYYYEITVNNYDNVRFLVYNGGKIRYLLQKLLGRSGKTIDGEGQWFCVRKRTHLPATLGAAHLEIDKAVTDHKKAKEHSKYIKGILETEPDNLKMIEGLEKLAEGEPEADYDTREDWAFKNAIGGAVGSSSGTFATVISKAIVDQTDAKLLALEEEIAEKTVTM